MEVLYEFICVLDFMWYRFYDFSYCVRKYFGLVLLFLVKVNVCGINVGRVGLKGVVFRICFCLYFKFLIKFR